MVERLIAYGYKVFASDRFDRGYGTIGIDFLLSEKKFDTIITNPPNILACEFIIHGLRSAERKLCLLLPFRMLAGSRRYEDIYQSFPPSDVYIFCERLLFWPNGIAQTGNGRTNEYAWFVWDIYQGFSPPRLHWIPPGTKDRINKAISWYALHQESDQPVQLSLAQIWKQ